MNENLLDIYIYINDMLTIKGVPFGKKLHNDK